MTSHTPVLSLVSWPAPARASGYRAALLQILVILLIGIPLFYGTLRAFPLYDDGWLQLLTRESGTTILSQTMPDRPLLAHLYRFVCGIVPASAAGLTIVSALLWFAFAFQAGLLWRRMFPDLDHYAGVVSCVTLAPIVVQAQICTVLVSLPCVLPTILVYGALLSGLQFAETGAKFRTPALVFGAMLLTLGILISEYATAASLSTLMLLPLVLRRAKTNWQRQRIRGVLVLFATIATISYLVYVRLIDLGYRPDVNPMQAGFTARHHLGGLAANLVTGVWHSVFGAYAAVAGTVGVYWDSKSTIVAVLCGALVALVLCVSSRGDANAAEEPQPRSQTILMLSAALAAALAPVALMGRSTTLAGFGSRFLIPAMPVAAALTVRIALTIFRPRLVWVPVALLGLVGEYAAVAQASSAIHQRDFAASIGTALRPLVAANGNYTVAILSINGMDYELTARATSNWTLELERKVWIYDYDAGVRAFGARTSCPSELQIHKHLRLLSREGPVDHLLWMEIRGEKMVSIEPYCKTAGSVR